MAKDKKPTATKARFIENMNDAQIDQEITKAQRRLERARADRAKYGQPTAGEEAMRDAFPLGAGNGDDLEAQRRRIGAESERALKRGLALEAAIEAERQAQARLDALLAEKRRRAAPQEAPKPKADIKWKITQKQERISTGLKPQILTSGEYQIIGKGVPRVYRNGVQLRTFSTVKAAKDWVAELVARGR